MTDKTKHLVNRLYLDLDKKNKEIRTLKNENTEMLEDFKAILKVLHTIEQPGQYSGAQLLEDIGFGKKIIKTRLEVSK